MGLSHFDMRLGSGRVVKLGGVVGRPQRRHGKPHEGDECTKPGSSVGVNIESAASKISGLEVTPLGGELPA